MPTVMESCIEDWEELEKEYADLEENHKVYSKKVSEVKAVQKKCVSSISHQRYRIKQVLETTKRLKKSRNPEEKVKLEEIEKKIADRKNQFREVEDNLPHENGVYLKIILGSVNVSLLSKEDKYQYKEDYERFKLIITLITLLLAIVLWLFVQYRVTDAAFQFLLVWYYCTLTIREHILKVNGSRIRGWWISHHFISTICAGILLIWPDGYSYSQFRAQFVFFSLYLSLVQLAQYYYQSGMLYRLRSLGERRNMDITVEGFQSWMWRGLTFVLPFLVLGYLFQLYNAYVLFNLSFEEECTEWQVPALGAIFFTLFLGNSWTTAGVIRQKFVPKDLMKNLENRIRNKYRFHTNGNGAPPNKVHDA